jgi:DNA ligase D-like protein (predicted 3'-phosphoesterase)
MSASAKKDQLRTYKDKRDFRVTPEPSGGKKKSGDNPIFVIQQHDASTMHWDFRLEVDGVLKSWVLPKGPSTDPREKRLAIPTEDHPLDYADFEGVIPEDEYGGGKVIVWDAGSYKNLMEDKEEPLDMSASIEEGHVEVWLQGKKLTGGYVLVRTGRTSGDKKQWLFIKMKDDRADARRNPVSTEPHSVISKKTVDEMGDE